MNRWNGIDKDLKDYHIVELNISFQAKCFKIVVWQEDGSYFEFSSRRFTLSSPFGLCVRAARRWVANQISEEGWKK